MTGFAVASNKPNENFHELFPTVPEGDYLIEGECTLTCIHMRLPYAPALCSSTPNLTDIRVFQSRLRMRAPMRDPHPRQAVHL